MRIEKTEKTRRTIQTIRIICTALFWVVLAFTILPIMSSVFVMIAGISSDLAEVIVDCTLIYVLPLLYASLAFIVSSVVLLKLLKSIENGEPFERANRKRLGIIGISFVVGSFLRPVVISILAFVTGQYGVLDILKGNNYIFMSGLFRQLIPDVSMLIGGLLVLALSFVFSYGYKLQREHDQTV